jgi:hypothetical protein
MSTRNFGEMEFQGEREEKMRRNIWGGEFFNSWNEFI